MIKCSCNNLFKLLTFAASAYFVLFVPNLHSQAQPSPELSPQINFSQSDTGVVVHPQCPNKYFLDPIKLHDIDFFSCIQSESTVLFLRSHNENLLFQNPETKATKNKLFPIQKGKRYRLIFDHRIPIDRYTIDILDKDSSTILKQITFTLPPQVDRENHEIFGFKKFPIMILNKDNWNSLSGLGVFFDISGDDFEGSGEAIESTVKSSKSSRYEGVIVTRVKNKIEDGPPTLEFFEYQGKLYMKVQPSVAPSKYTFTQYSIKLSAYEELVLKNKILKRDIVINLTTSPESVLPKEIAIDENNRFEFSFPSIPALFAGYRFDLYVNIDREQKGKGETTRANQNISLNRENSEPVNFFEQKSIRPREKVNIRFRDKHLQNLPIEVRVYLRDSGDQYASYIQIMADTMTVRFPGVNASKVAKVRFADNKIVILFALSAFVILGGIFIVFVYMRSVKSDALAKFADLVDIQSDATASDYASKLEREEYLFPKKKKENVSSQSDIERKEWKEEKANLRDKISQITAQLKDERRNSNLLIERNEKLENANEKFERERKTASEKADKFQAERARLDARILDFKERLEAEKRGRDRVLEQLNVAQEKAEKVQAESARLDARMIELRESLAAAEQARDDALQLTNVAEENADRFREECDRLNAGMTELGERLTAEEQARDSALQLADSAEERASKADAAHGELQAVYEELQRKHDNLRREAERVRLTAEENLREAETAWNRYTDGLPAFLHRDVGELNEMFLDLLRRAPREHEHLELALRVYEGGKDMADQSDYSQTIIDVGDKLFTCLRVAEFDVERQPQLAKQWARNINEEMHIHSIFVPRTDEAFDNLRMIGEGQGRTVSAVLNWGVKDSKDYVLRKARVRLS